MQMQAPRETQVSSGLRRVRPPKLLIETEPWARVFLRNLGDAIRPRTEPTQMLTSKPAPFWPDVFVSSGIPRLTLSLSASYHIALVFVLWALSTTFVFQTPVRPDSFFKHQQITYYDVSEYLPPIDTGSPPAKEAKKGEPEYSKQPIISVPPSPDNSTQTIIDPIHPEQLKQEQRLPNMVVWAQTPAPPVPGRDVAKLTLPKLPGAVAPAVTPTRDLSQLNVPKMQANAVAPAPDVSDPSLAKLPVVATPGAVEPVADVGKRNLGELNVGHSELVSTNPALPVPEQRAANLVSGTAKNALGGGAAGAVPPAPSVDSGGGTALSAQGQFVALSVRPAPPTGPIDAPAGNRRGIFAATPEGKPGAPGTPDIAGGGSGNGHGGNGTGAAGTGSGNGGGMPAGIKVGGMPGGPSSGGAVVAAITPPARPAPAPMTGDALRRSMVAAAAPKSVADIAREMPRLPDEPSKIEDKVFGAKKYYSMILNMPNLTSAGGSWIMRFAELKKSDAPGDLTAPVAMSKVDPAYPPELIRKNVEGTVALYAVIRADGTVGEIRVLESVDDKLDSNAEAALAHWRFRPATKNGNAVDLEAVVFIPFKIRKIGF